MDDLGPGGPPPLSLATIAQQAAVQATLDELRHETETAVQGSVVSPDGHSATAKLSIVKRTKTVSVDFYTAWTVKQGAKPSGAAGVDFTWKPGPHD